MAQISPWTARTARPVLPGAAPGMTDFCPPAADAQRAWRAQPAELWACTELLSFAQTQIFIRFSKSSDYIQGTEQLLNYCIHRMSP